jgi:hypothetical protein
VAPEVLVAFSVVVVVPPVGVADASCATLTPATTSVAMITSQPAVRLRTFFTCLAIDPYLLSATTTDRGPLTTANSTTALFRLEARETEQHRPRCVIWPWRLLTGGWKL